MCHEPGEQALATKLCLTALAYYDRGYLVIPVDHVSKNPNYKGGKAERHDRKSLELLFLSEPSNIGILTGDPSAGLIDVDLDHVEAIAAADRFLPPTLAVFGRPGKPRSHRIYRCKDVPRSCQHRARSGEMIVELLSTGAQTLFPPSIHECGEMFAWDDEHAEPALIDAVQLRQAVNALAKYVREVVGDNKNPVASASDTDNYENKIERCRLALQQVAITDQNDGSRRLSVCACRTVEYDLSEPEALALIQAYQLVHPFPQTWADEEIVKRIRDADKDCKRGGALELRNGRNLSKPTSALAGETKIVEVEITPEEYVINDSVAMALRGDQCLFQRGGQLVRIQSEPLTPSSGVLVPRIVSIEKATLREQITRHVRFGKRNKQDELIDVHPPSWCVQAVHARGKWDQIPHLTGIVDHPVLRPDGTILAQPGYDAQTGLFLTSGDGWPPFRDDYTHDEAISAAQQLLEIVADFPFKSKVHHVCWLAALLTVLSRQAFNGPAPLFLVDSNTRGSGKGLLCDTIALLTTGRRFPTASYTSDQAELQKQITATVLQGDTLVLFDNIEGVLGNGTLDRALTSSIWRGRILGESKEVDLPLLTTFFATGNNVHLKADTPRRICHIRLETSHENPEDRDDFHIPDLRAWILANRPRLLHAALIILAAFVRAGRPDMDLKPWGSYESWSSWIRNCVVWLGLPDPAESREAIRRQGDTEAQAMQCILSHWHLFDPENYGITCQELLKKMEEFDGSMEWADVRAAIDQLLNRRLARDLGTKFRHYSRRNFGGIYLDLGTKVRGTNRWLLYHSDGSPLRPEEMKVVYVKDVGHVVQSEKKSDESSNQGYEREELTQQETQPVGKTCTTSLTYTKDRIEPLNHITEDIQQWDTNHVMQEMDLTNTP